MSLVRSGARPRRVALLLPCVGALACASLGHLQAPPGGGVAVDPASALQFHQRAEVFYTGLLKRRFNTLETFNDPVLREHFASLDLFVDYYASLAEALARAHFQKSRPRRVEILEFLFEDVDHVRVQVLFEGGDGRPLRPDRTHVVRQDRWVRADGTWWVVPDRI